MQLARSSRHLAQASFVRLAAPLLLLGGLAGGAPAQTPVVFPADAGGQINFVMPSQNIGCTYTPVYKPSEAGAELSCDRIEPHYVRIVLGATSIRRLDKVGDQGCCSAVNVLPNGAQWSKGPFTCDSSSSGLACQRPDGRGFFLSRANIDLR